MNATRELVLEALTAVEDPEVGLNVVELGLIYGVEIDQDAIRVRMTMTSPSCPLAGQIKTDAEDALRRRFPEARSIGIDLVWDPPWGPELLPAETRAKMGWR